MKFLFRLTLGLWMVVGAVRADILREYWLNISGNAVSDLTSNPRFPDHPDGTNLLSQFEAPTDWADNYGQRVHGFLTAPVTGNYTFWIASDDNGELWLSPDDDPSKASRIAFVSPWTPPKQWNNYPGQKSSGVSLTAGKRYYIRAYQKEGGGGDNLAVGWAKPGEDTSNPSEVIPGSVLTPWAADPNYNSAPVIHVSPSVTLAEAPVTLHLNATVSDDGHPLPVQPEAPAPNDPSKLRWSWSEVSSPLESGGVVWSGNTNSDEAFTYPGSANPPGTVFTSDPTALLDVPGNYTLQFTASDGAKTISGLVNVFVKSTGAYRTLGYSYLSPVPRSEYTSPQTRYILMRFKDVVPDQISNFSNFVQVTGSQSGPHLGATVLASDGRTARYIMNTDFSPGEVVTVTLNPQLVPGSTGTLGRFQYQFVISRYFPAPGEISASGETRPGGKKERALDGDITTWWREGVVPDGLGVTSWIQYLYPGVETHVVNAYALASSTNSPSEDPTSWNFYGIDLTGNLVLLDHQAGQLFTQRSQWITNQISNSTDYRGYRLEITQVRDPKTATGVQLAELQFQSVSGALLREYWTDVQGTLVSDLTNDPRFPNQPTGRDLLPTFEAPTDWADNYGTRVRGYLTPPRSGSYTFWIASDDGGELWLSTDEMPANRTQIAGVPSWTGSREWGKDPAQKSAAIPLEAGKKYYIEALQKEGGGGDNLAVGWAKPGQPTSGPSEVIPGEVLRPWVIPGPRLTRFYQPPATPPVTSTPQEAVTAVAGSGRQNGTVGPLNQPRLAGAPTPTFVNGVSVPADFPRIRITVNNNPDSGLIFLDNRGGNGRPYNVIFDNAGSPVWYRRMPDERRDMKVQKNGVLTMLARDNGNHFNGFDTNYHLIKTYWADNGYGVDEHELQVLPNGHYLLIGLRGETVDMTRFISNGNPSAGVTEQIIQEFTARDELIFQWRSWDHFDIRDQSQFIDITGGGFDFPHINAIDVDTDGNILFSSRSLSEITKIDRETGEFIWRLGGNNNQMRFINDPLQGPRNQHAIRSVGTNRYTLFDNGDLHSPSVSRAVEYAVDPVALTATVVWQYPKVPTTDYYSFYMGNAERLSNSNMLINWAIGSLPKLTEVRPDGSKAFEMNWVDGFEAYRVWRCPWKGVATEPYLIVEPYPDNITLTFNQFGDTNVASYKIYGGTSPAPTTLLGESRVTRKSLSNLQTGQTYYFRVTAVNQQGVEGGYSNEESILVNLVKPGQNSLNNGDFGQGMASWSLVTSDTAVGSWAVKSGAADVTLSAGGASFASAQFRQTGATLIQGATYLLAFDAWSTKSRLVQPKLSQATAPFTDYSRIGFIPLSTSRTHFAYTFGMNQASDTAAVLQFNIGGSTGDVFISNVSLVRLAPGDFNRDGQVDWSDLKTLTSDWLKSGSFYDLNSDGAVNFQDLDIQGQFWNGK